MKNTNTIIAEALLKNFTVKNHKDATINGSQVGADIYGKWDIAIAIGSLFIAVLCIGALTISVLSSFFAGFSNTSVGVILSAIIVVGLWQFLGVPLLYGSLRWAWYTSLGENVPFYEVFYYFEDGYSYIRSISLGFRIFVRFILILIVFFFNIYSFLFLFKKLFRVLNCYFNIKYYFFLQKNKKSFDFLFTSITFVF